MTVDASLDAFLIQVVVAVCATRVVGFLQADHILGAFLFMAVGTCLRFRLDGLVMVACLTVVFGIVFNMIVMGEFVRDGFRVMTGGAVLIVDLFLMISHEDVIELFDVTTGATGWCLLFAGSVVTSDAILIFSRHMRFVGEDNFAAFVVQ